MYAQCTFGQGAKFTGYADIPCYSVHPFANYTLIVYVLLSLSVMIDVLRTDGSLGSKDWHRGKENLLCPILIENQSWLTVAHSKSTAKASLADWPR